MSSTNTSRRRRLLALGVAAMLAVCVDLAGATSAHASTPFGIWTGSSGPGTVTVVDGSGAPPSFAYDDERTDHNAVTWNFSTTETDAAPTASGLSVDVPWQYTGTHAFFQVQVQLAAFVTTPGGSTTTTQLVNAGPTNCCDAPSGSFSYQGTYSFTGLQQGDVYGFTFGGNNFDSSNYLRGKLQLFPNGAPVISPPSGNTSWQNATHLAANDSVNTDSIAAPGEDRWYDVPVQPDSQVSVNLSGLTADTDLAVFSDIGQAFQADLATFGSGSADATSLTALAAQQPSTTAAPAEFAPSAFTPSAFTPSAFTPSAFTPSAFTPSAFTPSAFTPSAFTPSAFTPSAFTPSAFTPSAFTPSAFTPSAFTAAYSSAQYRSLLAISSQSGTATKTVTVNTWNATGHFYIRVTGHNGAYSTSPFTLSVATSGGPCDNVTLNSYSGDSTLAASSGDQYQTVILTDSGQLTSAAMSSALGSLAAETNGVVVDVAGSQKVQDLQAQATQNASCPYASNLVANAIRDIVTSYRAGGDLKYVVIAGGDRVIPYFRYADAAGLAPEDGYVPPLTNTSRSGASLDSNDYLTDDPYGASTILSTQNSQLPIPDLAVGRLIETAPEITGQIDQFLADNGALPTPTSSLVTGYDFLQPVADQVESSFDAGMGAGATHDQLITDQGVSPTKTTTASGPDRDHSWTAADLSNSMFGSHHDLLFLGGHFSANNTLAADYSSTLVTTDLQAAVDAKPNLFANSLVISAGCHAGYNIQDGDGIPGVTLGLDWPEAFSKAGATLISGTGYQYGDTDFVAYSDKLYADLAKQFNNGTGQLAIGQVLEAAKQQYLQQVPTLSGIDTKALLQTTLYGLPMLGITMPDGRGSSTSTGASVTPTATTHDPGARLGLEEQDFTATTDLNTHTEDITDTSGNPTGQHFTWLSGPQGTTSQPGQPTLPLQSADVTSTDGTVLRGIGFWGGSYTDTAGVIPLVGAPTTETSQVHIPFSSPAFFPQTIATPNYYGALAGSGGTSLQLTPAQLQADGPSTDTQRAYQHVGLHLFYSGNTQKYGSNVPALAAAPTISQVSSTIDSNGTIAVSTHVAGDPSAGVHEVWVTYTGLSTSDPDYGSWQSVRLTQDSSDSTLWTGTITPRDLSQSSDLRFMVQAVNGVGVVALDNNGGALYSPGTMPGFHSSTATGTTLVWSGTSSTSGTHGDTATFSATLSATGTDAALSGQPISFSLGGIAVSGTTDSTGTAQVDLPLLAPPGQYPLSAAFAGDNTHLPSTTPATDFTVNAPATSLAISPADGTNPDVVDGQSSGVTATLTSGGQPLAGKPIFFLVKDSQGNPISSTVKTTDGSGTAKMGALKVAPGADTVKASFDQTGAQVGGGVVDATDFNFQGSSATTHIHGIATTTTLLTADTITPKYGAPVTLTATVSPSDGTGTVGFAAGGTPVGGCTQQSLTVTAHGDVATCTVSAWSPGLQQAVASYSGTTDYASSASDPLSVTIGQAATTTTLDAPASTTWGDAIHLSATVAPVTPNTASAPTGTVTFYDGSVAIGDPVAVATDGTAAISVPRSGAQLPAAGTHTWHAVYSGDDNYTGSDRTGSTLVNQASTETTLTVPATSVFGQPVVLTATVTPTDAGGRLAFYVDGSTTAACDVAVTVSGTSATGQCTVTGLALGAHNFKASFSHDANLTDSSGTGSVQVGQASSSTTLSTPGTARFGTPVQLTATVAPVAPGAGSPTGDVTFYSGTRPLGTAALSTHAGASTATLTVSGLLGGPNALSASYAGDSHFTGSTGSAAMSVTFTTTISGSSNRSITVGADQAVLISGSQIGSVTVKSGGAFELTGSMNGSITATGATQLTICGANLTGGVTNKSATGPVFIGGDTCDATKINGSVTINTSTGGVEVAGTTIIGSLSCKGNTPAPTDNDQPNTVSGSRSGQCATPKNF